jgi:hypothetical protein
MLAALFIFKENAETGIEYFSIKNLGRGILEKNLFFWQSCRAKVWIFKGFTKIFRNPAGRFPQNFHEIVYSS